MQLQYSNRTLTCLAPSHECATTVKKNHPCIPTTEALIRNVVCLHVFQYSTVQVQYSTVQYCTVLQYSTSTVQYKKKYSTVQYSISTVLVQYSTVQYSTVQYSTVHGFAKVCDVSLTPSVRGSVFFRLLPAIWARLCDSLAPELPHTLQMQCMSACQGRNVTYQRHEANCANLCLAEALEMLTRARLW